MQRVMTTHYIAAWRSPKSVKEKGYEERRARHVRQRTGNDIESCIQGGQA